MDASTSAGERIERSPADVLRLVVAGVALLGLLLIRWLFGDDLATFGVQFLAGFAAVPDWIVDVVVVLTRLLAVVLLGGGLVIALARARWRMLLTVVIAGVLAGLTSLVLPGPASAGAQPSVDVSVDLGPLSSDGFPTIAGIAVTTAVLTAAAPWLSRRWRRLGWTLVVGVVLTRLLTAPVSMEAPLAAFDGWLCGAAVLVALGAPTRRPTMNAVIEGLAAVGLPVAELEKAGVDARGSTPYFGVAADGTKLFVKALGDDERSADMLFRVYRGVMPRNFGDERPFSSLRRTVEHEALVALAASSYDVRTPRLLAFATAEPRGFVLAYEAIAGKSFDRLDPAEMTDDVLGAIWALVVQLRQYRIAHRDLRLANIFRDDAGDAWLIDFGFSELAASDLLLAADVAELTASSSVYVGPERAVALARAAVDSETLARAAGRLRPWALSGATRTAMAERPGALAALREQVAAAAAAPAPAAVQ